MFIIHVPVVYTCTCTNTCTYHAFTTTYCISYITSLFLLCASVFVFLFPPSLSFLSPSSLSLYFSLLFCHLLSLSLILFSLSMASALFLKRSKRRVTSLLYPCDYSSAYDNNHLLSGGADFSVRLWDLYKGILLHTFAVHGGVVSSIVTCPPDINVSPALSLSLIKTYITLANTCTCVFVVAPNTIAH